MPLLRRLTNRQKHFCDLYGRTESNTFGNASASYAKAGFKSDSPSVRANMMMKLPLVKEYLTELEEKRLATFGKISRDEYLQIGLDTVNALPMTSSVRSKYYEIVGKVLGYFTEVPQSQILVYNEATESGSGDTMRQRIGKLKELAKVTASVNKTKSSDAQK